MKIVAKNTCLIFNVKQSAPYARFRNLSYDIESKNASIINAVDTNSTGNITYSVALVGGGDASSLASVSNSGVLSIANGAMGHIVVTATISADGDFPQMTASYNVDIYKLYKAGESADIPYEDVENGEFQGYDGGYVYTQRTGASCRVYYLPKIFNRDGEFHTTCYFKLNGLTSAMRESDKQIAYASDHYIKAPDSSYSSDTYCQVFAKDETSPSAKYNTIANYDDTLWVRNISTKRFDRNYLFINCYTATPQITISTLVDVKDYND